MINSKNRRAWALIAAMGVSGLLFITFQPYLEGWVKTPPVSDESTTSAGLPTISSKELVQTSFEQPEKLFVVNLWALWCEPCKKEIPALKQLSEKYKDRVAVRFIQTESTAQWETGREFMVSQNVQLMSFWPAVQPDVFFGKLGLEEPTALPFTFLLKNGKIVEKWTGARTFSELELEVARHFE